MEHQLMCNGVPITQATIIQVCNDLKIDLNKVELTEQFMELCLLKQQYNNALKKYK